MARSLLREGKSLDPGVCKALWCGPDAAPFSLPFDRVGLPFSQAAAAWLSQAEPFTRQRFLQDAADLGAAPYAVIGDSHSLQLVRRAKQGGRWLLPFHWLCRAASARGLAHEEGQSGAIHVVRKALAMLQSQNVPVIFKFGQVDVEFVYAFKRIEKGLAAFNEDHYAAFVDETADRYCAGLDVLVPKIIRKRAILASVFPPALSDQAWARGYANADVTDQHARQGLEDTARGVRALEIPALAVRTNMHERFNEKLKAAAAGLEMTYLDNFTPFLGPDRLLDARYRGDAHGADHHLGFQAARGPTIAGLWSVLGGLADD